jgi:hypothetical protein
VTIAISLKVNDGLVLAADSASTLMGRQNSEIVAVNVYNSALKIFNLIKGVPVGAITWGSGSIGTASISTLMKDLRKRLSGEDPKYNAWKVDSETYEVLDIGNKLKEFIFDELYVPAFKDWPEKPDLGFIVAGYSSGESMAEEYRIDIQNGQVSPLIPLRKKEDSGITWNGQPEAITRLILGISNLLPNVLVEKFNYKQEDATAVFTTLQQLLAVPLVQSAMPIQDAIDLAEFLVDVAIKFSRFSPGATTVGPPIEIAAITKHEGFKWIKRKHFYSHTLNPEK